MQPSLQLSSSASAVLCGCWFARRHYRKKKRAALHEAATTAGPLDWELEVDEITCACQLFHPNSAQGKRVKGAYEILPFTYVTRPHHDSFAHLAGLLCRDAEMHALVKLTHLQRHPCCTVPKTND